MNNSWVVTYLCLSIIHLALPSIDLSLHRLPASLLSFLSIYLLSLLCIDIATHLLPITCLSVFHSYVSVRYLPVHHLYLIYLTVFHLIIDLSSICLIHLFYPVSLPSTYAPCNKRERLLSSPVR